MTMSFEQLLHMSASDIPTELPIPPGSYYWEVVRVPETKLARSGRGMNTVFLVKCLGAIEDFENPEMLEEYERKLGSVVGIMRSILFYFPTKASETQSEDDLNRQAIRAAADLTKFLGFALGLAFNTIAEGLAATPRARFVGEVIHQANRLEPSKLEDRIQRFYPLP